MATEKAVTVNVGGGLFGIMFLIFMTLKLTGHIDWSWWYVTMPLWGPITIVLGIFLLCVFVGGILIGIGSMLSPRPIKRIR